MSNKSGRPIIGYFNSMLRNEWAELPWQGAVKTAQILGVSLYSFLGGEFANPDLFQQQKNSVFDLARGQMLDGLILWKGNLSGYLSDDLLEKFLKNYPIPIIFLEDSLPGYPVIEYGNYDGVTMLMDHLYDVHGYRNIGFIGQGKNHGGFRARYQAYLDGLKAHELEYDPRFVAPWVPWIVNNPEGINSDLLCQWIPGAMEAGLEAVICLADPVAWWVFEQVQTLGIKVPQDLAIVGFDGFQFSRFNSPPFTTISPNFPGLGSLGVSSMIDLINGKKLPERIMVKPELMLGRTCGCLEKNLSLVNTCYDTELNSKKITIDQMKTILKTENFPELELLYNAFMDEGKEDSSSAFLLVLEKILINQFKQEFDLNIWHDIISLLQNISPLPDKVSDDLFHQARILISNAVMRQEGWRRIRTEHLKTIDYLVGTNIITTFQFSELLNLLTENLPRIEIKSFFLVLYEDFWTYHFFDKIPEQAKLVLGYDESGRIPLEEDGLCFPSHEIIPKKFLRQDRIRHWEIFPLNFGGKQIGYTVFESEDLNGLSCEYLSVHISSSLQGIFMIDEKNKANQRLKNAKTDLQRELLVARTIQSALLPEDFSHEDFEIAADMKTAIEVGGDYCDYIRFKGRDWFVIGDVSGHGVRAGLIMMMVQTSIHLLVRQFPGIQPSQLLSMINEVVVENIKRLNEDKYMTINILVHEGNGQFCFSGMHLPLLIFRNKTRSIEQIEMNGMWLGITDDISMMNKDEHFTLQQGDTLLLFTDGLTEAKTKMRQFYGMDRLENLFKSLGDRPSEEIVQHILNDMDGFIPDDDMTVVAIKRLTKADNNN